MYFTTTDLLTAVKSRGMLPDASSGSLSSPALLNMATEELLSGIVPMVLSAREKYYETYQDTAAVANQAAYSIPSRAIGGVLSSVQYLYGTNIIPLNPMDPTGVTSSVVGTTPRGFYFQNNSIVVHPTPASGNYTLRMRYFQRPSRLEQTANCAQVASFDPTAKTVVVIAAPSAWTTGTVLDFVALSAPFTPYGMNSALLGASGTTLSFSALPTTLQVGDWLALAEYTPIPEIPNEFFPVLAQATVCKALEAIGDTAGLQAANANLQIKASNAIKLITPRAQLGNKVVVSRWRNW